MNPIIWTITRTTDTDFAAVSNIFMSDGSHRADHLMGLSGNILKSVERPGYLRIGGLLTLTLGPKSFAAVTALAVGESVELGASATMTGGQK